MRFRPIATAALDEDAPELDYADAALDEDAAAADALDAAWLAYALNGFTIKQSGSGCRQGKPRGGLHWSHS